VRNPTPHEPHEGRKKFLLNISLELHLITDYQKPLYSGQYNVKKKGKAVPVTGREGP
jgi:hypothetical protein